MVVPTLGVTYPPAPPPAARQSLTPAAIALQNGHHAVERLLADLSALEAAEHADEDYEAGAVPPAVVQARARVNIARLAAGHAIGALLARSRAIELRATCRW